MQYIFDLYVFLPRGHKRKLLYLADKLRRMIEVLLSGGVVYAHLLPRLLEMEQMYYRRVLNLKFHFHCNKLAETVSVIPIGIVTRGDFLPGGLDERDESIGGVKYTLQSCSGCFRQAFCRRCKGCLYAVYCFRKCQKQHWRVHRQVCNQRNQ